MTSDEYRVPKMGWPRWNTFEAGSASAVNCRRHWGIIAAGVVLVLTVRAAAQTSRDDRPVNPLSTKQQMILDRLARLEDRMFRLRESLSQTEPESARRLGAALERAGELDLRTRVEALIAALSDAGRLAAAADDQARLVDDYQALLDVLLDRDPNDARRREALQRLAEIKAELDRLLKEQADVRRRAAEAVRDARRGQQLDAAINRARDLLKRQNALSQSAARENADHASEAQQQHELAEQAERLAEDVAQLAEQRDAAAESPADQAKPDESGADDQLKAGSGELHGSAADMKSAAKRLQTESEAPSAKEPQQQAEKKLERALHRLEEAKKALENGKAPAAAANQRRLADDTQKLGQRMQGDAENESPQDDGRGAPPTPGQPNVDRAQDHMRRAAEKLDSGDAEQAVPEQDRAIDELERAQRELEQALKQKRLEEQEEVLRSLEARFQEMLVSQTAVNDETAPLSALGAERFTRAETLQCAELADRQEQLAQAADTCVRLLEEDGSTVVFPQVVQQLAGDMRTIAARLTETKVGPLTIAAQQDVRATLEELVAALKRLREKQKQQRAGGAAGGGAPPDPPLVPTSAELKLLKNTQLRINHQTQAAAAGDGAEPPTDVAEILERAARRQAEAAAMARQIQERAEKGHGR